MYESIILVTYISAESWTLFIYPEGTALWLENVKPEVILVSLKNSGLHLLVMTVMGSSSHPVDGLMLLLGHLI